MSGHKSNTQSTAFFLNIFLNIIAGIAFNIGEGQKIKIISNFLVKILKKPINDELRKKVQ